MNKIVYAAINYCMKISFLKVYIMAVRPPILRRGDTIGIVTPGSPLSADTINAGIAVLKNMGFNVLLGKYVYSYNGYLAATDQQRASDIMSMFKNRTVKLILSSRGGVGVAGILPVSYTHLTLPTKRKV